MLLVSVLLEREKGVANVDTIAAYCVRLGWHLRVLNNAQLANLDKASNITKFAL